MTTINEHKSSLIKDFTPGQRDYILAQVFPIIKKALVHFVNEATNNGVIVERPETPDQDESVPSEDVKPVSIFQMYPKMSKDKK